MTPETAHKIYRVFLAIGVVLLFASLIGRFTIDPIPAWASTASNVGWVFGLIGLGLYFWSLRKK